MNNKQIRLVKKIYQGGQANIWLAQHQNQTFVIKFFYQKQSFQKELFMVNQLPQNSTLFPTLLGVIDHYSDILCPNGGSINQSMDQFQFSHSKNSPSAICYEYIEGGDLSQYLQFMKYTPFSGPLCRKWCLELIEILSILRQKNIAHRDLKPSNILVTSTGNLKLCDFGISQTAFIKENKIKMKEANKGDAGGTNAYLPPEVHKEKPLFAPIQIDYYAFGLITFEILSGFPPFKISSQQDQNYKIFVQNPKEFWEKWRIQLNIQIIDEQFVEMIQTLLNPDRRKRGKFESLKQKSGAFRWLKKPMATNEQLQDFMTHVRKESTLNKK